MASLVVRVKGQITLKRDLLIVVSLLAQEGEPTQLLA